MGKRGRPRKEGARYDCGKLKPDGVSPTLIRRILDNAGHAGIDRRLGSELGRLLLYDQISPTEASAGFRMAEIYGRFERAHGRRRNVRSPSYEMGFSGAPPSADTEQAAELAREARGAFEGLCAHLLVFSVRDRAVLEALCVDDRPIGPAALADAKAMLNRMAVDHFGLVRAGKKERKLGSRPPRAAQAPTAVKRVPTNVLPFPTMLTDALQEHVPPERISEIVDFFRAVQDRKKFRTEKKLDVPVF